MYNNQTFQQKEEAKQEPKLKRIEDEELTDLQSAEVPNCRREEQKSVFEDLEEEVVV
jgi:hypothetical protein